MLLSAVLELLCPHDDIERTITAAQAVLTMVEKSFLNFIITVLPGIIKTYHFSDFGVFINNAAKASAAGIDKIKG